MFEGAPAERVLRIVTIAVVVFGVCLRARGFIFSTFAFWLDEAGWAIRLMDLPLVEQLIRPIGFMAISRWLGQLFGPSETVLRLMPWCAGVATTVLAPALSRRLFQSAAARLLFVSVIAFHPAAIDLSKEFKPYSVSLFLHLGLLLLALRYCDTGRKRELALGLAMAVVAVLFAQDVVLAYPGFFLVLAIAAFSARRFWHLGAVVGMGAVTLGIVGACYVFMWSKMDVDVDQKAWGKKYDVFYVPHKGQTDRTDWTVSHYSDVAGVPGLRRRLWKSSHVSEDRLEELASFDKVCWVFLHIAGLTFLIRARRYRDALLLATPGVLMVGFNVLGFWPLGDFRANLFELVYMTGIAAAAFDRTTRRVRFADLLPAGVLVFAPLLFFEKNWNATKQTHAGMGYFPQVIEELLRLSGSEFKGTRERIFADNYSCRPLKYYMVYHPKYKVGIGAELMKRMRLTCSGNQPKATIQDARKELRTAPRVWIVATQKLVVNAVTKQWPSSLEKAQTARVAGGAHLVIAVELKKVTPPPEPEPPPEPPVHDTEAVPSLTTP